ncbi:MAG: element excision factor XisI family protein [Dolichospermum sp.]
MAIDLFAAGFPKVDIVLGFRHPRIRPFSTFGVF